jgi:hypothetical protein
MLFDTPGRSQLSKASTAAVFLSAAGLLKEEIGKIWDSIALGNDEDLIVGIMRSFFASVQRFVLVENPNQFSSSVGHEPVKSGRVMMVKLENFAEAVPFKSLGDGVNRLLGILLALVKPRGGVLLIDEIENGLHYSRQAKLWEVLLRQVREWDVQIFATTHSWDCVSGFAESAKDLSEDEALLLRLERRDDRVVGVPFAPREVEIARHEDIELR